MEINKRVEDEIMLAILVGELAQKMRRARVSQVKVIEDPELQIALALDHHQHWHQWTGGVSRDIGDLTLENIVRHYADATDPLYRSLVAGELTETAMVGQTFISPAVIALAHDFNRHIRHQDRTEAEIVGDLTLVDDETYFGLMDQTGTKYEASKADYIHQHWHRLSSEVLKILADLTKTDNLSEHEIRRPDRTSRQPLN